MLHRDADLIASRRHIVLITDKGFSGREVDKLLAERGIDLLRPARKKEKARWGAAVLKKIRQLIESVNDTLKGQLHLERHGARTIDGVAAAVAQRILAMATAIWHNFHTGQDISRSLIAYDH